MGRQILGDFGGTKMAITSLKIKMFKTIKKFCIVRYIRRKRQILTIKNFNFSCVGPITKCTDDLFAELKANDKNEVQLWYSRVINPEPLEGLGKIISYMTTTNHSKALCIFVVFTVRVVQFRLSYFNVHLYEPTATLSSPTLKLTNLLLTPNKCYTMISTHGHLAHRW